MNTEPQWTTYKALKEDASEAMGIYQQNGGGALTMTEIATQHRAMLAALKIARSELAKAAITLEQYEQGPIREAMKICNAVIVSCSSEKGQP